MDRPGRLVLLGHPVGHSLSPRMQNAALRIAGIPLEYVALDVPPGRLDATLDGLIAERGAGNVTIPHKEAVAARARLTPLARRVGAANTFWVQDGDLHGDNTDVGGFDAAVRELSGGVAPRGRIAVLGAGGAAAAVLAAIERWPDARAVVHGRTPERAAALCARFADARVVATIDAALDGAAMVVNTTPVGLTGDEYPAPLDRIPTDAVVVDLAYRPGGTPWSRAAAARGHRATDGRSMLVEQGALAFERWFGVSADRAAMRAAVG